MNENLKNNNYLTSLITKLADIDKKISFLRLKLQNVEPENRESVYSFIEKHGKRLKNNEESVNMKKIKISKKQII